MRLTEYLWLESGELDYVAPAAEMPSEFAEYYLRTEVYHCTPDEFRRIPWPTIKSDLLMSSVVQRIRRARGDSSG